MKVKAETTGFTRGGMLFLEPPERWRAYQRDIWSCHTDVHCPRRCESSLCNALGDCVACGALQGEACQKPRRARA